MNVGNVNSVIIIGLVFLSGDVCSFLVSVGVGVNCFIFGFSYFFKGMINVINMVFSNVSGSFIFEENVIFSGVKWNGGVFIFNKEFKVINNIVFNSGSFNFKGVSFFNGVNFNNVIYIFND